MDAIDQFVENFRLEKFENEQEKAECGLQILEKFISSQEWKSVRELMNLLNVAGNILQTKVPWETTPYNMVQRVIKIVKDELHTLLFEDGCAPFQGFPSMVDESSAVDIKASMENVDCNKLRNNVLDVLSEQKAEIEQCQEIISLQGETKIHNDETILTCGYCPSVLGLLLRASKQRKFNVIVAEAAPKYDGELMASSLSSNGIQTTLIQDCAIFALMSRVNKVIIGCRAVLKNGGMKTFVGATLLACSAKYYSVPLYVCSATYKFSTEMSEEVPYYDSPGRIVKSNQSSLLKGVNTAVAKFDYVPPENITSFITNNRGIAPSYVYREVNELYHPAMEEI